MSMKQMRAAQSFDIRLGTPGEGFKIAMATLDLFRTTVGAAALSFVRRALDETSRQIANRHLFGEPLAGLQMVQGHIVDMATEIDAAALLVSRAAWAKDTSAQRATREAAQRAIDTAVQLLGGDGARAGRPVESLYREIRALRIYEGASDVQKIIVASPVAAAAES